LKGITSLAGATIMADGHVALILDVFGLAQKASVVSRMRERALNEMDATEARLVDERHGFVLAEDRTQSRVAIPLEKVARLEKFPATAIERLGDQLVVQYRGEILPLLDVAGLLRKGTHETGPPGGESRAAGPSSDLMHVVVYSHGGRSIGLIVNQILDIADQVLTMKSRATRDNVLFSTVIQGHVTEFLDVEGLIRTGDPGFFAGTPGVPA
jgi:two-component system chemotaxis sensor kinase CheA